MLEEAHKGYRREGYALQEGAISSRMAADLARQIEEGITAMAADLGVSREMYLSAVCRWNTPNPIVEALVAAVTEVLGPSVSELLGAEVRPRRGSVFRLSAASSFGTHAHQDASYWVWDSSSRYHATTWVALDETDEHSAALRVIPGSHLGEVAAPVDYWSADFVDPAASWGEDALTLPMSPGDAVSFDPKLWHAAHPAKPGRIRRSIAIRWVFDAATPPTLPNTPSRGTFGMYTSGTYLRAALRQLAGGDIAHGAAGVRWALEHDLTAVLPDPEGARNALASLLVLLRASEAHHASDQRGMVWEAVRDRIVAPTVGLTALPQTGPTPR